MSSTNHTAKVGDKRKRSEEEEIQSPTPGIKTNALPNSNSKRVPTHKQTTSEKKGKKRHDSSAAEDELMDDGGVKAEERKHFKKLSQDNLEDESEDEEYDSEDEEDNLGGFIVPDGELEEGESQDGETSGKRTEDGKRHRKKKKAPKKLDDDDFDLIQENTGKAVKRRKRLQKVSEKEAIDQGDAANVKHGDSNDEDAQLFSNKERKVVDEDDEMIDTTRKRYIPSANRNKDSYVDNENVQKARNIFEDSAALGARVKSNKVAPKPSDKIAEGADNLEGLYDADELDDQFATRFDREIQNTDIPERLQLKIGDRLLCNMVNKNEFEDDISFETEFIYERLIKIRNNQIYLQYEKDVKDKINKILTLLRKDYYDVPMIVRYRKFDYSKFLSEDDIWLILHLDQEYGKFHNAQKQIKEFFLQLFKHISSEEDLKERSDMLRYQIGELDKCKNSQDLMSYGPLVQFLKQFFAKEVQIMQENEESGKPARVMPRIRGAYDMIESYRTKGIDAISGKYYMNPLKFIENITNNYLVNQPPESQPEIQEKISLQSEDAQETILQLMQKFTATEFSVQPFIRNQLKKHFYMMGTIKTEPTEEGAKTLDVFHPSYRVKRIDNMQLSAFRAAQETDTDSGDTGGDLFLDICQNEKKFLIKVTIQLDAIDNFINDYVEKFTPAKLGEPYKNNGFNTIKYMITTILIPELEKEIRNELTQEAEDYVIKKCQDTYNTLIMTGPFQREVIDNDQQQQTTKKGRNEDIIPDRPRCNVMGVIMQQVDANNSVVTLAIVDKHGELVSHTCLSKLMPPRKFKQKDHPQMTEEEQQRDKKHMQSHKDETLEHEKDKTKIQDLIKKFEVDLIVVGGNKLEARTLKITLSQIAENLKNYGSNSNDNDDTRGKESECKEAFVIWGSLEVPKLFSNSHLSQKLLKGADPTLKQAISLARFEQDPMNEILNLWSFVNQENQALQLNLHPMQKMVNQAKLSDSLEDVNVKCVNAVGVELNLVIDHDHMHILLSFISGIGPRKAKKFIQNLKQLGRKIFTRGEIYIHKLLGKECHLSAIAFFKIKVPLEEQNAGKTNFDIVDQTRIHPESYSLAHKVARDVEFDNKVVDPTDQYASYIAVKSIIQNPGKLKVLDLPKYKQELEQTGQTNFIVLIDYIIEELKSPFKDPRVYRTNQSLNITNTELFYMLIDETVLTFRRGIIVTAQVIRVFEAKDNSTSGGFILCKLDNGLDAKVEKQDLDNTDRNIQDLVTVGTIVTGRIKEIRDKEEAKFSVSLTCKRTDLESHKEYLNEPEKYYPEDLINPTFKVDSLAQQQSKYQPRRINHPKFKNINSQKAVQMLVDLEPGEYVFRPSSKGTNNITLTWKFWHQNIVHIDINEHEKAIGANIGSKLSISREEFFENLQEIVERYISPCNKLMREAAGHVKYIECETSEDLENALKAEKAVDPNRIPYKVTVLPAYPQHIVLGYIPKTLLVKEYIKVKPKGYLFHEQTMKQIQVLINWFKEQYKQRDYIKFMKRQKSPRARAPEPLQRPSDAAGEDNEPSKNGWANVSSAWAGGKAGNSVHDMNDDGDTKRPFGDSGNNRNNDGRGGGRGRGGDRSGCFSCGEQGHMSRECPNKDQNPQRKPFGGGGRGRGGNRDDNDNNNSGGGFQKRNLIESDSGNAGSGSGWAGSSAKKDSPKYQAPSWGDNSGIQKAASVPSWGGNDSNPIVVASNNWGEASGSQDAKMSEAAPQQQQTASWGQKTPIRSENFAGGSGWGESSNKPVEAASDNWGSSGGFGTSNNNDRRQSPERSPDNDGRGSRGRGFRGRGGDNNDGGFRGGRGRGGDAGGSRACFKCGEEGHFSRECPNQDSRGGDRGGDRGGRASGGGRGGPMTCYKCQQEGHMARECPNEQAPRNDGDSGRGRGRGRGGPMTCFKCNQEGHMSRECTNEQSGDRPPYKRQRRDDDGDNNSNNRRDDNRNDSRRGDRDNNTSVSASAEAWGASSSNNNNNNAASDQWGSNSNDVPMQQTESHTDNNAWGAPPKQNLLPAQADNNAWGAPPKQQSNPPPNPDGAGWGNSNNSTDNNKW